MKIILNGQEFTFQWKHKMTGSKRYTRCYVKRGNETVGQVRSHVDSRDPYIKNKGRIRSLSKAIKELRVQMPDIFQDKENRTNIWIAYTVVSPQKWHVNA